MGAVETGCVECLHMLLEAKASINTTHPESGYNPFHFAALLDRVELAEALVRRAPLKTPLAIISHRSSASPVSSQHDRRSLTPSVLPAGPTATGSS